MNDAPCPREGDVLRAAETGEWPTGLEAHLGTCAACHEVHAVAAALRLALDEEPPVETSAADDIWWRARWQARQDATSRALRPLDAVERLEPLVALVVVASLVVMRGEAIAARLSAWMAADATGAAMQAVIPAALMPLLLIGAGLGGLVLLVGIGAVLASE